NVFVVHGKRVSTPPTTDGALDGITRGVVLELARKLGFSAEERSLGRLDLFSADEAFITGTGAGLVRVRSLDGETIGDSETAKIDRGQRALRVAHDLILVCHQHGLREARIDERGNDTAVQDTVGVGEVLPKRQPTARPLRPAVFDLVADQFEERELLRERDEL